MRSTRRCGRWCRSSRGRTASDGRAARFSAACGSPITARASSACTSAPSRAPRRTACGLPRRPATTSRRSSRCTRRRVAARRGVHAGRAVGRGPRRRRHHAPRLAHRRPGGPPSGRRPARRRRALIADGHHRYETARTYDAIGGDGNHRYTLMALVALEDPGLAVFGYHRLLSNLGEPGPREALRDAILAAFEVDEVPSSGSTLPASRESASSATSTHTIAAGSGCDSRTRRPRGGDARRLRGPPHARRRSSRRCFCGRSG